MYHYCEYVYMNVIACVCFVGVIMEDKINCVE